MANAQLGAVLQHIRELADAHRHADQTDGDLLRTFLAHNDHAAFATLVKRHGPLIFAVCRRVLQHVQDAEDAFQATFLVLARRAASIRNKESLASWLHGVAYRMATNARRAAARRRKHEGQVTPLQSKNPEWAVAWQEVQTLLDEELQQLPEIYRGPFVLCCLENKSCAEAAKQLGVKEGSVRSRLSRARKQLQLRLSKRGIALTAVLSTTALSENVMAAVSPSLVSTTVKAGVQFAASRVLAAGTISANVIALVEGVTKTMFLTEGVLHTMISRKITIGLLMVGLGIGGFAAVRWVGPSQSQSYRDGERVEQPATQPSRSAALPRPDGRADLARLQGAWEVEGVQGDGLDDQKALGDFFRQATLVFKDDRLVTWGMPDDTIAKLKVDTDREPKGLELTQTKGILGPNKMLHWVYELDGDRLAIAFRQDNARPTAATLPAAARGWSKTVRLSLKRTAEDLAEWQAPLGGPDAAALRMFAAAAKAIEQAKTVTWKTTPYRRRTADGTDEGLRVGNHERHYFKAPGLYRVEAVNDQQQIKSITLDDVVGLRRLQINPQKKTAVLRHLSEAPFPIEGPFPQQMVHFRLKGKSLKPIAPEKIGTQEVIGFRSAFYLPREDQQWSYDFLFDAKSHQMTGYRVPARRARSQQGIRH